MPPELSSAPPRASPAPAVGLGDEEGWQLVDSGRRSVRAIPPNSSRVEALERSLAFKRWARGWCFRCLERGHQVRTCREPFRCIRCRRPGHRERNCHLRSPVGHSPSSRSRSPSAGPRHAQSRTWAGVVHQSSPLPGGGRDASASVVLDSDLQAQFASLRMELLQLVADRIEEITRPLRDEAAAIKLSLARVAESWERVEAASTRDVGCPPVCASDAGLLDS
jgi:hypothetical protein